MHVNLHFLFAMGLSLLLGGSLSWAESTGHRMIFPEELRWEALSALPPGAKVAVIEGPMDQAVPFTARVKVPSDYRIPPHWHPVVERVTVISGTLHMGIGDSFDKERTTALPPGSLTIMQPRTHHFAWTREETVIQLNGTGPWGITYVNPADDPRNK